MNTPQTTSPEVAAPRSELTCELERLNELTAILTDTVNTARRVFQPVLQQVTDSPVEDPVEAGCEMSTYIRQQNHHLNCSIEYLTRIIGCCELPPPA